MEIKQLCKLIDMKKRIFIAFSLIALMLSACQTDGELGGLPVVETLPVQTATSSTAVLRAHRRSGMQKA